MNLIQRWLLLWLVASSALAYAFPAPFLPGKAYLKVMIAAIMFCIGLMLPRKELVEVRKRWTAVFAGVALQYLLMPTMAFAIGSIWGLSGHALAGMMVVGCVPGAMASNVLTMNANGNTSYSVCLTTTATMLSPLITPLALSMTLALSADAAAEAFSAKSASLTLLLTIVLPVLLGFGLQRRFPSVEKLAQGYCPSLANIIILLVIAIVVAANRNRLGQASSSILAPLILLNALGYAGGYFGGWLIRLPESMRRALTLEVGMQNAGAGAMLAAQQFGDEAALGPAIYTFGCMLSGVLLARYWASRPPRDVDLKPTSNDSKEAPREG